jgi:hypothetical protein
LLIVIIWLLLSVSLHPKVITLSGLHCTSFPGSRKSFTETERNVLEQQRVYQQFKDMESRGEFAAANSYSESEVKKNPDPDSTTLIIETGAY